MLFPILQYPVSLFLSHEYSAFDPVHIPRCLPLVSGRWSQSVPHPKEYSLTFWSVWHWKDFLPICHGEYETDKHPFLHAKEGIPHWYWLEDTLYPVSVAEAPQAAPHASCLHILWQQVHPDIPVLRDLPFPYIRPDRSLSLLPWISFCSIQWPYARSPPAPDCMRSVYSRLPDLSPAAPQKLLSSFSNGHKKGSALFPLPKEYSRSYIFHLSFSPDQTISWYCVSPHWHNEVSSGAALLSPVRSAPLLLLLSLKSG